MVSLLHPPSPKHSQQPHSPSLTLPLTFHPPGRSTRRKLFNVRVTQTGATCRPTHTAGERQAGRQAGLCGWMGGGGVPAYLCQCTTRAAVLPAWPPLRPPCRPASLRLDTHGVRLTEATVDRRRAWSPQEGTDLVTRTDPATHSCG